MSVKTAIKGDAAGDSAMQGRESYFRPSSTQEAAHPTSLTLGKGQRE